MKKSGRMLGVCGSGCAAGVAVAIAVDLKQERKQKMMKEKGKTKSEKVWKTLLFTLSLFTFAAPAVQAETESVSYLDYDATSGKFVEQTKTCEIVTDKTTEFTNSGWYAVKGEVKINGGSHITVSGSAHLILVAGATLTITNVGSGNAAISVTEGKALTIYGQREGTGKLVAAGGGNAAGIGGGNNTKCGAVTVNGGWVTAIGQGGGKGIGSGSGVGGATVTIRNGTVQAEGWNGLDSGTRISGGSIMARSINGHDPFAETPKDATGKIDVYCVTVEGLEGLEGLVSLEGLGDYGVKDIYPIGDTICLYLPNGNYLFAVNGNRYRATVNGKATTAMSAEEDCAMVTVGALPEHVKAAEWTSGDGSVTNPVANVFFVEKGTENVKVVFTPEDRYVLDKSEFALESPLNADYVLEPGDLPTATATHASVTLPAGTVGYGYVVSNLTDQAKITASSGTTYLLPVGKKVGIYAVPEEGYALKGEPYVIDPVVDGQTIDENALPKATHLPAVVTVTSAKQRWPWNGKVDVGYALSNTAAGEYYRLITAVTVGDTTKSVTNEVGAVTSGTVTVDCAALFGAGVLAPASVTMAVRAYSAPAVTQGWQLTGPFLIIDLNDDANGKFPVMTYETAADLPENAWNLKDGWSDDYKTKYLVMRKVKAGEAYPCQPASSGTISGTMTPAKDYWIGVHQVTQEQYARVMGGAMPSIGNKAKPANISWNTIRGSADITTEITKDSTECFMQQLCKNTGLGGFDLPTEAQWEIAARAGSAEEYGSYVDGYGVVKTATKDNLTPIAWYKGNVTSPQNVGQLRPNLWGLYDTAGNVWEWCRDCDNGRDPADVESPRVPYEGGSSDYRVFRGGACSGDAGPCRPSRRSSVNADCGGYYVGFRLSRICNPDAQNK